MSGVDSVAWYKDGLIQRDSADFKQTFDGTKARLEIGEVFLDDDGTYTCAVKNSNAECRSSCKVSITGMNIKSAPSKYHRYEYKFRNSQHHSYDRKKHHIQHHSCDHKKSASQI